jgi:hypothetical protein
MDEDTRVEWRDWGEAAFAEAAETGRPVLLSLTATWCADCHRMDARTYGDPRVAANVGDGFVPVRVDVDRHPRVRERYNMGAFPSTVFCTPAGEVLTGATSLGPEGLRQVLERVRERWDATGSEAGRVPRALAGNPTPAGDVGPELEELMAGHLAEAFDEEFAGWGDGAKFPMPRTVEFALKRDRERALRTLDAVRDHLLDDVAGGFFRFAGRRDWGDVHHEKLLDANAGLVRAFANGYLYTGDDAYRRPADRTIDYLVEALWNGTAFGGSQGPAAGREYFALDAEDRAAEPSPRTDLAAYAGGNALAADALLTYHAYTDDERARTYAERTLDYLESRLISSGVVAHAEAPDVESGLLEDHARVTRAFARAAQVLGEGRDVAAAVADHALATLHDDGAFRDGPAEGPGLLDRPLRPIDANVAMAAALLDLGTLTGTDRYREAAREAVAAFAGAADRLGPQVGGYGSVAARLVRDPPVVDVGTPAGSDLHRAALRIADHETVVRPASEAVPAGTAAVRGADADPATTPDELLAQVAARDDPRRPGPQG